MRELKFRAWDRVKCNMLYGVSPFAYLISDESAPLLSPKASKHDDCEFEQFTGLRDKNGKEIYEGDIVKAKWFRAKNARLDTRGEVEFNDGWFYIHDDPDGQDRLGVPIHNCYDMEVIGNIHEDSELLEDKK